MSTSTSASLLHSYKWMKQSAHHLSYCRRKRMTRGAQTPVYGEDYLAQRSDSDVSISSHTSSTRGVRHGTLEYIGTKGTTLWWAFFVLGTINNLSYVIVGSASQSIAGFFNRPNDLGLITFANVGLGFFFKAINAFAMENVTYVKRMLLNTLFMALGLLGVAMSFFVPHLKNFGFALFGIVLVGVSSAFGESVLLGFLRMFPSTLVGGWSSGTGMAGVGGSAIYLILSSAAHMSDKQIFLATLPTCVIYYAVFAWVHHELHSHCTLKAKKEHDAMPTVGNVQAQSPPTTPIALSPEPEATECSSMVLSSPREDVPLLRPMTTKESEWQRILKCIRITWWLFMNCAAVYFFEYIISTGAADKANVNCDDHSGPRPAECSHFEVKNAYRILSFCYQFGVLLSRSSLKYFRIKRVDVLTVLQGVNFALWLLQDEYRFMSPWVQFPVMIYVGLLGGASYVNIFYLLLQETDRISEKDKELCINIVAMFINIGIAAAAGFTLLMDHTFFKHIN